MNDHDAARDELFELAAALNDGEGTPAQASRLRELLTARGDLLPVYAQTLLLQTLLLWEVGGSLIERKSGLWRLVATASDDGQTSGDEEGEMHPRQSHRRLFPRSSASRRRAEARANRSTQSQFIGKPASLAIGYSLGNCSRAGAFRGMAGNENKSSGRAERTAECRPLGRKRRLPVGHIDGRCPRRWAASRAADRIGLGQRERPLRLRGRRETVRGDGLRDQVGQRGFLGGRAVDGPGGTAAVAAALRSFCGRRRSLIWGRSSTLWPVQTGTAKSTFRKGPSRSARQMPRQHIAWKRGKAW